MKKHIVSLLFLLSISMGYAQTKEVIYLWPNQVPNEQASKSRPIQTPDTSRNVVRITNITNPSLTVYRPKEAVDNHASIIISPGGGYRYLAINSEGYEVAEWLNTLGFTAFVLEYRAPDNRLGALNDLQRAIRVVRSTSENMGLNSDKIGVMGFSAGGHLSLLASTNYEDDSYEKTDVIDSISSRPDFSVLLYPAYLDRGEDKTLTPEIKIHKSMPPTFIFGTVDDRLSNGFFVLATAMRKIEAAIEFHILPTGGHGYGMRKGNPAAETWPVYAEMWLQEVLQE
ncbi:MAG: xylanase [Flavobacteriaceae bacterium]|nr:MAG: xylanase [Flavobacteriaceae bacterium]